MDIRIRSASEHNLKNIDVQFGDGLTVVTGVSGSGKTSLLFDTLYHEAHRRFLEVFLYGLGGQRWAPASVESITGLDPTIAVGQNLLNRNPRSNPAPNTVSALSEETSPLLDIGAMISLCHFKGDVRAKKHDRIASMSI